MMMMMGKEVMTMMMMRRKGARLIDCEPTLESVRLHMKHQCRPRVRREYPLNLSILISGGKETNRDSLSKGD